jgi:serine/threonine protein kinase
MGAGRFHEAAEPVNDGEIEVLRRLRDDLDPSWQVIGNFEFLAAGNRWYECDALALHESGYGFLIETKAWTGPIIGNDKAWLLPTLDGDGRTSREPPIHLITTKMKKLATLIRTQVPAASSYRLDPLVVLVTEDPPELTGKSELTTVLYTRMIDALGVDPRTPDQRKSAAVPPDVADKIFDYLAAATRPPSDTVLGDYVLDEELELRADDVQVWRGHPATDPNISCILKRYPIDLLAPPAKREEQLSIARRHHTVISELDDNDVVPLFGAPFEGAGNEFVVVTRLPRGDSLETWLAVTQPDPATLDDLIRELFRVVSRVHAKGVVHRWLRPRSIWVGADDLHIRLTDFDVGRVAGTPGVTILVQLDDYDTDFTAPEALGNLALATMASDVYSLAAIARFAYGDSLNRADPHLRNVIEACLDPNPTKRPADAGEALRAMDGPRYVLDSDALHPQDVIDDRYFVKSRHDGGGLTVVYRVYDNILKRDFGAKFVRSQYRDYLDAAEEWNVLQGVPEQPNIAKPTYVGQMRRVTRGDQDLTCKDTFLLSPWIVGRPLDEYLDQVLPLRRVLELGRDLATGLEHLHQYGIIHRDLKPENVLVRDDHSAVILDFNVSQADSLSTTTSIGTASYRAPEVTTGSWTPAADLYSLGVCLTELLVGGRLGTGAREWVVHSGTVDHGVVELLAALLQEEPSQRGTAGELVHQIDSLIHGLKQAPAAVAEPPPLEATEIGNPYVARIRDYFSQSSRSNSGTRGLDIFGKWLYVDTQIDNSLRPRIVNGELSLVVITGNAGDGKTAFIRRIEDELESTGAIKQTGRAGNGSQLSRGGHTWVTNWDGSQDEAEVDNHAVLTEFFEDFAKPSPTHTPAKTAVIAINEGRLVDFLDPKPEDPSHERFRAFAGIIHNAIAGHEEPPPWMVLVNLNRRVLTQSGDDNIVSQILRRLADERLWEGCRGCPAVGECPNFANAQKLRDPVLGARAIARTRETLDLVRLRRRLHITTRDLLSALAYMTVGNDPCSAIIDQAASGPAFVLRGMLYNRLFAAADDTSDGAAEDRLLAELGLLDPADAPHPNLDGRLWLLGADAIASTRNGEAGSDGGILLSLRQSDRSDQLRAHQSLRRKAYFEREEPDYVTLLPYRSLVDFQDAIAQPTEELRDRIASAISASEGLRRDTAEVAVRLIDDTGALDRSYVRRPADDFELTIADETALATYVEYEPDLLRIQHRDDPGLSLDIDVDIFEALDRMSAGFTPSREDLQTSWLSLATFKERLAALPSKELLLQSRMGHLTNISIDQAGTVVAERVR